MPDEEYIADDLRRALEQVPRRPSADRVAALQREVARQRFRRPLRRAAVVAVAAALALIAFSVSTLSNGGGQRPTASDPAMMTSIRVEIDQLRAAIAAGDPVMIERVAQHLRQHLQQLPPADRAAVADDVEPLLDKVTQPTGRTTASTAPTPRSTLGTTTTQPTTTTTTTTTAPTSTTTTTVTTNTTVAPTSGDDALAQDGRAGALAANPRDPASNRSSSP
jgi:hypothetical protein